MKWKTEIFWAAALIVFAAGPGPQTVSVARASGCDAGDKIDSSTAAAAKNKIERAGFRQ